MVTGIMVNVIMVTGIMVNVIMVNVLIVVNVIMVIIISLLILALLESVSLYWYQSTNTLLRWDKQSLLLGLEVKFDVIMVIVISGFFAPFHQFFLNLGSRFRYCCN